MAKQWLASNSERFIETIESIVCISRWWRENSTYSFTSQVQRSNTTTSNRVFDDSHRSLIKYYLHQIFSLYLLHFIFLSFSLFLNFPYCRCINIFEWTIRFISELTAHWIPPDSKCRYNQPYFSNVYLSTTIESFASIVIIYSSKPICMYTGFNGRFMQM